MGREKIREVNRRHAQQRQQNGTAGGGKNHEFDREINAVEDLHLDPTGKEPIDDKLLSANLDNTRVFFPEGVYRATGKLSFRTSAPCALVGPKATLKMDAGKRGHLKPIMPGGLIKGLTLDLTAEGALFGLQPMTDGYIEVINVTIAGYAPPIPETEPAFSAMYIPLALNSGAAIRTVGLTAVGGTAADMHNDGSPESAPENQMRTYPGVGVWQQNKGTIQLIDCKIRGWQNGIYGSRHKGEVHIFGGLWWNNPNCQIRIGGGSFADRVKMVIDENQWSMEENPGPYYLGEQQGVNGVRIETGGNKGVQDEPVHLRNLKIIGVEIDTIGGLIDLGGTSPMTKIKNCVVENGIDCPAVLAEAPGSQAHYPPAPNPTVQIADCLITGNDMDPAVLAQDRPGRVVRTCFQYPAAAPSDIVGLDVGKYVTFGSCGPNSGLSAPEQVASGEDISDIPIPTNPDYSSPVNGTTPESHWTPSKKASGVAAGGFFAAIFGGLLGGLGIVFLMSFVLPALVASGLVWAVLSD